MFIYFLESDRINTTWRKAGSSVMSNTNLSTNSGQLLIPDESTLSRLVAARLDLPMAQRLLDQNFRLSIIKRCREDQLRFKRKLKNKTNLISNIHLFKQETILYLNVIYMLPV